MADDDTVVLVYSVIENYSCALMLNGADVEGHRSERPHRVIDTQTELSRFLTDETTIQTTVTDFKTKTGSRRWRLITIPSRRRVYWKQGLERKKARKWPPHHVHDGIPEYYDVLSHEKGGTMAVLSFVHVVRHVLGRLPHNCLRSLRRLIYTLGEMNGMKDLSETDAEQVAIHVFLQYLEENGIESWTENHVERDVIDMLRVHLKQRTLYHRFMLNYNLLELEDEHILLALEQELSTVSDHPQTVNCEGLYSLSCEAFDNYGKYCRSDIRTQHHLLAEWSSLKKRNPAFQDILIVDENFEKLLEAEAGFNLITEIGEGRREMEHIPRLSRLSIEAYKTSVKQLSTTSDALALSYSLTVQRENGRSRSTMNTTNVEHNQQKTPSTEQILMESYLACVEIARITGNITTAGLHMEKIITILPELDVSDSISAVVLLEDAKYYLSLGKLSGGSERLEKALRIDDRNLDVHFYYGLTESEGARELILRWLREEPEKCPSRSYLIFLTESDLPLLEHLNDLYVELRYVMGLEDANVKFLKDKPDRGHDTIHRVAFPARTLLAYLAFQVLVAEGDRQNDKLKWKCQQIMRTTASRCSENTAYQAYCLLGHLQEPKQAEKTYRKAIKEFGGPGSFLVKQRLWEQSQAEKK